MADTKTALITGASSGIGLELAKIFASKGINLIIASRNIIELAHLGTELSQKHKIYVEEIEIDLSRPGAAKELYNEVKSLNFEIDYLINNAGFGDYGLFHESDWDKQERMINLNMLTLTHLTRLFLPEMVKKKSGKIMNVASTAAFQPGPLMSVYYASKAYVLFFSEAIANELEGTGVTVTALCPGPTKSGFQKAANVEHSKMLDGKSIPGSKEVAEYGYNAMMKGKRVAIHGMLNRELAFFSRRAPKKFILKTVRRMNEGRK
ncbi:MAG: SDR family oxidoreductase [Ignavibacteriae bacterium]|nr:SDR family oxidoreductase [Ignavibacteriota bacterium]